MAKAILVLNEMPKGCFDCRLRYSNCIETICVAKRKTIYERWKYTGQKEGIPDWCPLKELPESIDSEHRGGTSTEDYANGFDDCLALIMEGIMQ